MGETWLHMLHQLDTFDRMPLDFSKYAPDVIRVAVGEVKVGADEGEVTAVAGHEHHRMRDGCHYADITLVDPGVTGGFMRVGVVQADYGCETEGAASDGIFGWAWAPSGAIYHNGTAVDVFDEAGTWGKAGDRLTLELDCDLGRLSGWVGDTRVGPLACGLHTHEFPGEGDVKREFAWSVEMEEVGCCFRIQRGKPRLLDKLFDVDLA